MKNRLSVPAHSAPETIHDYRMLARRIGIIAKLCSTSESPIDSVLTSSTNLKDINAKRRAFGPVREIDVLIELVESHRSKWLARESDANFQNLVSWLQHLRNGTEADVLQSWDPESELPRAKRIARSATSRLQALDNKQKKSILKRMHHIMYESSKSGAAKDLSNRQMHKVRRRIRDCRYAMETLTAAGCLEGDVKKIKTLRKMQSEIGQFTDLEASARIVKKLRKHPHPLAFDQILKMLAEHLKCEKKSQKHMLRHAIPKWSDKLQKWPQTIPCQ